ncbi:cytochrome P450 2J5 [Ixodes scapularis]|uniref:cytochrome P450 2J5 n=1 Tax=Ixodes scapularis TaxID=6945 RepID=UPI001A9F8734|nr:cytochrome P450 2J5 [Ixodes scapularis]
MIELPIGAAGVVVLNDMESINEFYCSRDGVHRSPEAIFFELTRGTMGMSNLDGKEWTENRSFSMRVFRDLGFGKTSMEQHIMEELQELVRQISDTTGSLISVLDYMIPSMSNVIAALLFGKRFELGDAKRDYVAKHLRRLLDGLNAGPVVEDKPKWLCRVTTALPFTRLGLMRRSRLKLQEFIKDQIREHRSTLHPDINRDYIDGYLKKMKERHCEPVSSFQENYLLGNTVESLVGGSGPSSFRVFWLFHVCAQNPITVQSRIQKEIDDVVGHWRRPTWQDRKAMPFTMACLQEILRWKSLTPVGNQRGVLEDTFIGGYLIPKGSTVLLNSMGVHRNQEHWESPDEFDASRFLTNDDANLAKKYDHFVPFGLGRIDLERITF